MTDIDTYFKDEKITAKLDKLSVEIADKMYELVIEDGVWLVSGTDGKIIIDDIIEIGENIYRIEMLTHTVDIRVEDPLNSVSSGNKNQNKVISPMAGIVSEVAVKNGDRITKGDTLLIISAMKMENKIVAQLDSIVKQVHVKKDEQVNPNQVLLELGEAQNE